VFTSINPANGEKLRDYPMWDAARIEQALSLTASVTPAWNLSPLAERVSLLRRTGEILRKRRDQYATLMSQEMGKLIGEARAEIEKCALCCDYYVEHAAALLAEAPAKTDAAKSYVAYQPLGSVLAIMPWNFPFWQLIRAAAPTLTAGNSLLLKHADNVPGCALALAELFHEAGYPQGVFQTLMIGIPQVEGVIKDARVHAVTLTGSERAGRAVGRQAGEVLKKCILELGGSDAFVVLEDADVKLAAEAGVKSRYQNAGQSCIAAKRFIVVDKIAAAFLKEFQVLVEALKTGDPLDADTTLAPMARFDLRAALHQQVQDALSKGARALTGGAPISDKSAFYAPTILDSIQPGMRAWYEELFGPVASIIRVVDEEQALKVANGSNYGLGGSVWTRDKQRGEKFARCLQSGSAFVNGMVKSDPRLPFGGIKNSGYGRELACHGILEFTNVKSVWIG